MTNSPNNTPDKALVERLRSAKANCNFGSTLCARDAHNAADEIERLSALSHHQYSELVKVFECACQAAGVPSDEIWARANDLRAALSQHQHGGLAEALKGVRDWLRSAPLESGYCCCGSPVASHGMGDGHSPVDELAYSANGQIELIDAALSNSPVAECAVCRHETDDERRERIAQVSKDVADLPGAIERLQAFADSQNLPMQPGDHGPAINFADVRAVLKAVSNSPVVGEDARGWKCNNCQTIFTSIQQKRRENDTNGGPRCPHCKADGQYTYPYALHKGDPCEYCGVGHDDVASGQCHPKPTLTDTADRREAVEKVFDKYGMSLSCIDPEEQVGFCNDLASLISGPPEGMVAADTGDQRMAVARVLCFTEGNDGCECSGNCQQTPASIWFEFADALIAASLIAGPPEGFVVVPVEPTEAMLEAAKPCPPHWDLDSPDGGTMKAAIATDRLALLSDWQKMIAARPGEPA